MTWLGLIWLVIMVLGMPIAVALAVASMIHIYLHGTPLIIIPQRMAGGIDSFPLLAVPGFILAANLMNSAGITDRLFLFARVPVGRMRGGWRR